jgi:putative phosphoesterase
MRILLVADIHANWAALSAISEQYDLCLCMGDLVEYGPQPRECVEWARRPTVLSVRGNHDHGCVQDVDVFAESGFRYLTMATRPGTRNLLTDADHAFLAELPTTRMLTLEGKRFLLVHATPRDPLEEYTPPTAEAWQTRLTDLKADYVGVGHTHQQFQLTVGKTTIINPGSVGLPRDGDPRVRYAIIENGQVTFKQTEYDIESTVAELKNTPYPMKAQAMLAEVYRTGKYTPIGQQPVTNSASRLCTGVPSRDVSAA